MVFKKKNIFFAAYFLEFIYYFSYKKFWKKKFDKSRKSRVIKVIFKRNRLKNIYLEIFFNVDV